jgi:multidrug efflux pump subunit AcrA (membrane-fusion protein)
MMTGNLLQEKEGNRMNRTKLLKTGLVVLAMITTFSLAGCSPGASSAATLTTSTTTVVKGDITTYITASGNLSYPDTQDVRLEVGGTVSEVLVKAGDLVEAGDVLVKLEDTEIQDTINADEVNISNLQISLEKVVNKYRQLIYPYTYKTFAIDIPESVVSINEAVRKVTDAQEKLSAVNGADQSAEAASELRSALEDLDAATITLTFGQGDGIFLTGTKFWDLRSAQLDVDSAQAQIDKVLNDLESARADLEKTVVKLLLTVSSRALR